MYELMKKMTVHESKDIFPEVLDKAHLDLAHKHWNNYVGDFFKNQNKNNYNENLISARFKDKRNLNAESNLLQSMMFFMIWNIMASLNCTYSKDDPQIPKVENGIKTTFISNQNSIIKQSIISKIIKNIIPTIQEKKEWTNAYSKNSFDKKKQIFKFEKEEEKELIKFSQIITHKIEDTEYEETKDKDYNDTVFYEKFEKSKAIYKYKNEYPFEWYTSQCQEKLLNDLAKDFKLNAKGLDFNFDKVASLLEEIEKFLENLPMKDEYNELLTKLKVLSKQKETPKTSHFDSNNSEKEYAADLIKNINNFLKSFQPDDDSNLKKACQQWNRKLDNLLYQLDGTNIKICQKETVKELISILYPLLKNSNIEKKEKNLIRKLRKIYAADNPFAYTNIKISKENVSGAANLIYNISHYIEKEKTYAIGQINFIKEAKLKYLSTQEIKPNKSKSLAETDKTITKLKQNRKVWSLLDTGFSIPKFRQSLKPFISIQHNLDELTEPLIRHITCKLNDETDTTYDWNRPNDYRDANACNLKRVYLGKVRNSETHYTKHGSIKNLLEKRDRYSDELFWDNLLWALFDSYKLTLQSNIWIDNNIVIPSQELPLVMPTSIFLTKFIANELRELIEILWNKIHYKKFIEIENLLFGENLSESFGININLKRLQKIKQIKKMSESEIKNFSFLKIDSKTNKIVFDKNDFNQNEIANLDYKDKYFTDNLFIERVETALGFMYCSNGLSIPPDILSYKRTTNKTIPLDEDFLDFYRVPTSLYLIYLTMALTEENIAELKAME